MPQNRIHSLDALRGFAILTMVLSGVIPYGVLPAWMYHAQVPPPDHVFNPNLPGLTWVDLVFPFFLFALGAAIPLALSRRIEKGASWLKIILSILERGFLLGFFAIYLRHVRPHVIDPSPASRTWLIALLGFALMFPIFSRLPDAWSRWLRLAIRASGWTGAIVLLALLRYPDGGGFSLNRSDIIIIVLTNVAVFGSLIWLATRNQLLLRLGILGMLIALRLANPGSGWVHYLWNASPIPWIYKLYYLQYLFIVIPGTIVGDLLLSSMKLQTDDAVSEARWSNTRYILIVTVTIASLIVLLAGMQARWTEWTALIAFLLCCLIWWLVRHPQNRIEYFIRSLCGWGIYWLILGLIFESYEGGIKKDHPTMSYYFITTGLAIFVLIGLTVIIDIFRKRKWLNLLIENGQNPMIAYVGFANFIWPILALSGVEKIILNWTSSPWLGFLRGLVYTIILALLVGLLSRRRVFWRT